MRKVFADTFYWVALVSPNDRWHATVRTINAELLASCTQIWTTDEVLGEFLTFLSSARSELRLCAAIFVAHVLVNPNVHVVEQSHSSFLMGLELYRERPDKEYSLVDCVSMQTMRDAGITEVLTGDRHFLQESFSILMQAQPE